MKKTGIKKHIGIMVAAIGTKLCSDQSTLDAIRSADIPPTLKGRIGVRIILSGLNMIADTPEKVLDILQGYDKQ